MEDKKVRVLLEDIDHKFKAIWEVTKDNPKRFEKLEKNVNEIKEDIAVIKAVLPNKVNIDRVVKIEKDIVVLKQKIA